MPLTKSSTDAAFSKNVAAERRAGKPRDQALAIAFRIKREAKRATGGRVSEPSDAQKEAGNYKKDHGRIHGLDIAIENRKGATRSGTDKGGKSWSVTMPAHYGYIKRTEGADGDHVDCYLGPHSESSKVFIINQQHVDTGKFDEHKCMLGFNSAEEARATYRKGFSDGRGHERIGSMKEMSIDEFKAWLKNGSQRKAFASGGGVGTERTSGPSAAMKRHVEQSRNVNEWYPVGVLPDSEPLNHMNSFRPDPAMESAPDRGGNRWIRTFASGGEVDPAIALASSIRRASGGQSPPWFVRNEARSMLHTGPIVSAVGGRTDRHRMSVPSGSYVVPADVVSGLGQGNTANGHSLLSRAFTTGPYGSPMPQMARGRRRFANGGEVGEATPILAAGGEFVIDPESVARVGGGDVDRGHSVLDAWILHERNKIIKEMKSLPGPARD